MLNERLLDKLYFGQFTQYKIRFTKNYTQNYPLFALFSEDEGTEEEESKCHMPYCSSNCSVR